MSARKKLAVAGCFMWLGCGANPTVGVAQSAIRGEDHDHGHGHGHGVEHVLLLSIDGFHDFDLTNYVAAHPTSALASLVARGTTYTQAYSTAPSDSFPATLAMTTGGSPVSTGVYYDASWDDRLSPAGSNCATRGALVSYKETINFNANTGSGVADINVAKLPRDPDAGCTPVFPHQYLKVNTIYEVIKAAGMRTAVADKHPSYEILNGPSGTGLDDFYGPEFNAAKKDITKIIANDELKVVAVLHQLDGFDHTGATQVGVPAILGMNFQAVNIAQKFSGYKDAAGTIPDTVAFIGAAAGKAPGLAQAMDYVDQAIGRMLAKMDAQGLTDSTLVIMASKHGNSPVDRSTFVPIDPDATFPALINSVSPGLSAQVTADTLALIWLTDHSRAAEVADVLRAHSANIGGGQIYVGSEIDALFHGEMSGNPTRHPDILVQPGPGVVYATAGSKLCDHAGLREEDRHVAMVMAGPHVEQGEVNQTVSIRQVAPTILKALGLKGHDLDAVRLEHTHRLPVADDDEGNDDD
ncbi:MAG: Type phosphodiesterase/nucleotide pyrophosphatase [Myxococcales bacterium]|nr:Type phosphodiesterase/nucleotide pyrophosphatase [Myxococcales bacterium]